MFSRPAALTPIVACIPSNDNLIAFKVHLKSIKCSLDALIRVICAAFVRWANLRDAKNEPPPLWMFTFVIRSPPPPVWHC
jgi:hypothetical protein